MIIRSMNNAKEFPEGKTVQECLKALDAFPRGTLAAQSGGVVRELNDPLMQDCTLVPLTLENEEGRRAGTDRILRGLRRVRPAAGCRAAPPGYRPH